MTQLVLDWSGTADRLDMVNDREQIRAMERRSYGCGSKREFHASHDDCPGLVSEYCGQDGSHTHHRWAEPDRFFWCNGVRTLHSVSTGDPLSRLP